jgi:hypothetical protein
VAAHPDMPKLGSSPTSATAVLRASCARVCRASHVCQQFAGEEIDHIYSALHLASKGGTFLGTSRPMTETSKVDAPVCDVDRVVPSPGGLPVTEMRSSWARARSVIAKFRAEHVLVRALLDARTGDLGSGA